MICKNLNTFLGIIVIFSKTIFGINYFEIERNNKPCSFFDTINITDGIKFSNGSINHNGITYTTNQYKYFNYYYPQLDEKKSSIPHIRGCFCHYRKCIRSCCPKGYILDNKCIISPEQQKIQNIYVNLELENNKSVNVNLSNSSKYGVTYIRTCSGYLLEPEKNDYDQWYLVDFKTQIKMLSDFNDSIFNNKEFCLAFNLNLSIIAMACQYNMKSSRWIEIILPYCMFIMFIVF